jgi:hypothetical protein
LGIAWVWRHMCQTHIGNIHQAYDWRVRALLTGHPAKTTLCRAGVCKHSMRLQPTVFGAEGRLLTADGKSCGWDALGIV